MTMSRFYGLQRMGAVGNAVVQRRFSHPHLAVSGPTRVGLAFYSLGLSLTCSNGVDKLDGAFLEDRRVLAKTIDYFIKPTFPET